MADVIDTLRAGRRIGPPDALVAAFAAAAESEGLLDVAYATYDAPFGRLVLGATPLGLVRLAFDHVDDVVAELSSRVSPRILLAPGRLDVVRRQLDEYFAGARRMFELDLDMRLAGSAFRRAVLAAAEAIPYGQVRSYTEVAATAGNQGALRAVGTALGANPVCVVVPCHRVLRSDGTISGYAGGADKKDYLLHLEGAR